MRCYPTGSLACQNPAAAAGVGLLCERMIQPLASSRFFGRAGALPACLPRRIAWNAAVASVLACSVRLLRPPSRGLGLLCCSTRGPGLSAGVNVLLPADTYRMAKKPELPRPMTWTFYKMASHRRGPFTRPVRSRRSSLNSAITWDPKRRGTP